MVKNLLETQEQQDNAAAQFRSLVSSKGWQFYLTIINQNIEVIEDHILTGKGDAGEELSEAELKVLRKELALWKEMRDTPLNMLERFTAAKDQEPGIDPFETVEETDKALGI